MKILVGTQKIKKSVEDEYAEAKAHASEVVLRKMREKAAGELYLEFLSKSGKSGKLRVEELFEKQHELCSSSDPEVAQAALDRALAPLVRVADAKSVAGGAMQPIQIVVNPVSAHAPTIDKPAQPTRSNVLD